MFKISAKTFAKNCVNNILDKEKTLWLQNKDIGEKVDVENIYGVVDKEIKGQLNTKNPTKKNKLKSIKNGSQLIDDGKLVYIHEDIIIPIIMSCRISTP